MKLCAQLYSLRDFIQTPGDTLETFRKVKAIGYEAVQFSGGGDIGAENLRAISEETGLPILCTHSKFERIVDDTDALIREHRIFGCPVIGLGSLPKPNRGSLAGAEEIFRQLETPVKKILDAGLHFAYHNHAFEFAPLSDSDALLYDVMLERFPEWHFLMDTYWVEFAGHSATEYIAKIGKDRLVNIHYKDMAKDEARSICACGDGVLDFAKITEVCEKVGVQNVYVEQDNAVKMPDPFGEMEKSFRHLSPILRH